MGRNARDAICSLRAFTPKPAGDKPPADAPLPGLNSGMLSRRGAGLRPKLAPSLLPGADAPFLKRERDASQGLGCSLRAQAHGATSPLRKTL